MDSVFNTLNKINVNEHTEPKGNLTYLSWVWAWAEVKKLYPDAAYTVYENRDGWNYFTDGKTCWVKTGVTINGLEHIEYLPVMDFKNRSIKLDDVTSFDVNRAIQRSITKACARHGLGLYIYAGEDLPEGEEQKTEKTEQKTEKAEQKTKKAEQKTEKKANPNDEVSYALQKINANHAATIMNKCLEKNIAPSKILEAYALKDLSEMNMAQFQNCVKRLGIS